MVHPAALPGFLAASKGAPVRELAASEHVSRWSSGDFDVAHWGLDPSGVPDLTLIVSKVVRDSGGDVSSGRVAELVRSDPSALTRLLPPFAAVAAHDRGLTMVADSLGFQHLYHPDPASTAPAVLSSSCLVAGRSIGAGLDETAVAVQSLLGWQLGQRTLLAGIQKLEPGAVARLGPRGLHLSPPRPAARGRIPLREAVVQAAALLRASLASLLDEHPDAVLQLTGGMDSRLLLSAIPERRRQGLHAMTLEVPGTGDVAIARSIAQRYGIRHEVHGLATIQDIDPADAWDRCFADALKLDAMSDPVALASQRVAEQAFDQGVRISGLGGEIARGFYYVGKVRERSFSRADAERLASWRMFVNEAVEPGVLTGEFSAWAREVADTQVYEALAAGGDEWFRASDELYVRHRMQRWAGATDTAVSDQRVVVNPMLDPGFLDLAARLVPVDKARSRFLALLQMELDPELGHRPLEGRPSPSTYADPPRWQPALDGMSLARRVGRKGVQKVRRSARPPAGGTVMTGKVVELWRARPELLEPLGALGFVRPEWVEDVVRGRTEPRPSSVAFLTNLLVAKSSTSA